MVNEFPARRVVDVYCGSETGPKRCKVTALGLLKLQTNPTFGIQFGAPPFMAIERKLPAQLSTMTAGERLQREKAEIWSADYVPPSLQKRKDRGKSIIDTLPVLVAEGDSWFDYLPGKDVLDQLRGRYGYTIHKFAQGGDTLNNMVYGTEISANFQRKPAGLVEVLEAVRANAPGAVLLSAGGNDIAGDELMYYLNHSSSTDSSNGVLWLREKEWAAALRRMETTIRDFSEAIWAACPRSVVVMHGYARPVPDGRGVINIPGGWHFIGPWLRPSFSRMGYTDWRKTEPWVGQLLDDFNGMLSDLSKSYGRLFRYVDLRPVIGRNDWSNELHPTNNGFGRAARQLHEVLKNL